MRIGRMLEFVGLLVLGMGLGLVLLVPAWRRAALNTSQNETIAGGGAADVALLIKRLDSEDQHVRDAATKSLAHIGPDAVPALGQSLKNPRARVRREAAFVLHEIGSESKAAIGALIRSLHDEDQEVRVWCTSALGNFGPSTEVAVGLSAALADKCLDVRRMAAEKLSNMGSAAKAALPALTDALQDEDVEIRRNIVYLLRQWDGFGVEALGTALLDEDQGIRVAAAEALAKIGPDAEKAVPLLSKALRDKNAYVRERAAYTLARIGAQARFAVPDLIEALRDQHVEVRLQAAQALWHVDQRSLETLPVMVQALSDGRSDVRRNAAKAIGNLGTLASDALSALRALSHDEEIDVRIAASATIRQIAPERTDAIHAPE